MDGTVTRDRPPTSDELALWQRAMGDVARRRPGDALSPARPAPRGDGPNRTKRQSSGPATGVVSAPKLLAPGALEAKFKRHLARGRIGIDARLDLHGAQQAEAHARLTRFIEHSRRKGHRSVLVITGKGSAGAFGEERGVLRRLVPEWLRQTPLAPHIIGLAPAAPQHGGAGALYVLLRTKPPKPERRSPPKG